LTGVNPTDLVLTANSSNAYVVENGNLWRVDPALGAIAPPLDSGGVFAATADDSHVYYAKSGVGFLRQDQAGGSTVMLANPAPPTGDFFCSRLASDANHLYYFVYNNGDVFRVSTSGGAPEPFSFGSIATNGATVSAGFLYWTPAAGPRRVSLTNGSTPENLAPAGASLDLSNSPVVVGQYLYWGEAGNDPPAIKGRVWRRDLTSGEALALADNLDHVWGVAVDGPWIYFTVMGATHLNNGGVFRVAR
jgi:hypothetical protein